MLSLIKGVSRYVKRLFKTPYYIELLYFKKKYPPYELKNTKTLTGRLFSELNKNKKISSINEVEFQVYSQWGDDGIIQYLINNIDIPFKTFIEFGVENYTESNTRFLLVNNNWSGLVIDGSKENIDFINNDPVSWAHELHTTCSFITKDNINSILSSFLNKGYNKQIGLLSVDIDGNDYWVWKEISVINPVIVIIEFNALFGHAKPWTIEYKEDFVRGKRGEPGFIVYGSSLSSLCDLANEKGYDFIGCNNAGNNAYFIRSDKNTILKKLTPQEGFTISKFREIRDINYNWITGPDRYEYIKGKYVYNTRTGLIEKIS